MEAKDLVQQINDSVSGTIDAKLADVSENFKKDLDAKMADYDKTIEELKTKNTDLETKNKALGIVTHDRSDDDPTCGFKGLADFAQSVYKSGIPCAVMDKRLKTMVDKAAGTGLVEATGSDGGFLIPVQYRTELLQKAIEKADIMNRCTTIPMKTNSIKIPYIKDTTHASGTIHGGIRMYWEEELAEKTSSKPSIGQIDLVLHKIIGMCYASDEILQDSPISVEPLINMMFSDALAWTIDGVLIAGAGAGQPLGIKNSPCLVSVAKETNQIADTIVYDNVIKMYMRMAALSRKNAVWLANPDILHQLMTMSLAVGTGGSAVFLPSNGAASRPYDVLFGKPIIFSEHCDTLGDTGDIYFADFSQYLVGRKTGAKGGLKADTSIHLKFDYDQTAFRFVFRMDGQPWWVSALTPKNGSSTISPFIKLDERA